MVEAKAKNFKLSGDLKLSVSLYKLLLTRKWQQLVAAEDQFYSQAVWPGRCLSFYSFKIIYLKVLELHIMYFKYVSVCNLHISVSGH